MAHLVHKTPSVGSVIKKIMLTNPELSASEMAIIVRQSLCVQGNEAGEFASAEFIDETKALRLAQATRTDPKNYQRSF